MSMPKRDTMRRRSNYLILPLFVLCLSLWTWAQAAPNTAPPPSSTPPTPPPSQAQPQGQAGAGNGQQQGQTGQQQGQSPQGENNGVYVFRSQVEEVILHATVYDDHEHMVTDLSKSAFEVFEDGVPQKI